jgi:hypothetical protein
MLAAIFGPYDFINFNGKLFSGKHRRTLVSRAASQGGLSASQPRLPGHADPAVASRASQAGMHAPR